jgi:hypothetical protein
MVVLMTHPSLLGYDVVFWGCSYRRFGGTYCLHLQGLSKFKQPKKSDLSVT